MSDPSELPINSNASETTINFRFIKIHITASVDLVLRFVLNFIYKDKADFVFLEVSVHMFY